MRPSRRARLLLIGLGAVLALGSASPVVRAQEQGAEQTPELPVSWGVRPGASTGDPERANFVLEADPGDSLDDTLVVENLGGVELVLGVYASDAFNTVDGELDLLPADEEPADVGSWVTFEQPSITVPAGGTVEVPFTIRVPEDAPSGDHVGGVLTSLTVTEPDAQGNRVRIERRLGTRLYLRVSGELDPALSFTALEVDHSASWNPLAAGSMTVRYRVENTGNVRLRATRAAHVEGSMGLTDRTVEGADLPELLPGGALELTQEVGGVWPALGTTVEVELRPYDPSGARLDPAPRPVVGRTTRTLVPYPQLALLLVLAVGGVLLVRNRRRRDRRIAEAVDRAVAEAVGPRPPAFTGSINTIQRPLQPEEPRQ
jgi:hypothetical protein